MRAIVLAGGHATRLWPITKNRAKPLLPVNGRPIIDFIIKDLEKHDDIEKIYISTNEKFAGDFRDYKEDYGYDKVDIVVEEQDCEEEKPGTIGAMINLLDQKPSDDYVIIGGDNYYSLDIDEFLEEVNGYPALACYKLDTKEEATSFGVVEIDDDNEIVGFQEKPDEPRSKLASTACYYYPEKDLDLFDKYEEHFSKTDIPAEQYLDEPGRLIEWAHKKRTFKGFPFTGEWVDVGTRDGYLEAHKAVHGAGQQIIEGRTRNTKMEGNVYVMKGAEVNNSRLKDCIVFPEAKIEGSSMESTIVDQKARVSNADMQESLVGEHTRLMM